MAEIRINKTKNIKIPKRHLDFLKKYYKKEISHYETLKEQVKKTNGDYKT